jgi:hypothetical protein
VKLRYAIPLFLVAVMLLMVIGNGQTRAPKQQTEKHQSGTTTAVTEWKPLKETPFYKYTVALPPVDKIEIYRLGRRNLKSDEEGMWVPEAGKSQIVASTILYGKKAERLAVKWRALKHSTGAACFVPAHYLRFYSGSRLLLDTTICFGCSHFSLPTNYGGTELWSFDARGKTGKALWARLERLLGQPIPKEAR